MLVDCLVNALQCILALIVLDKCPLNAVEPMIDGLLIICSKNLWSFSLKMVLAFCGFVVNSLDVLNDFVCGLILTVVIHVHHMVVAVLLLQNWVDIALVNLLIFYTVERRNNHTKRQVLISNIFCLLNLIVWNREPIVLNLNLNVLFFLLLQMTVVDCIVIILILHFF